MNEFLQRLKQRKLVQWAIAYVAAAFALLQGIDVVAQQFGWPEGIRRGVTLALVLGFFLTLILAWYHGERGAQRVTGAELLIIGLVLAFGGGFLWRFAKAPPAENKIPSGANDHETQLPVALPEKSIAVLPFKSLSDERSDAYFADGMQAEILRGLVKIADLKVISRPSMIHLASLDLSQIAYAVGARYLLDGSVQR